jgi:hypothetical protein
MDNMLACKCGNQVPIPTDANGSVFYRQCGNKISVAPGAFKAPAADDSGGFFGAEKAGMKKGVLGGIIMMVIAVVWFVLGYMAGYISFYPPILFLIGLFAFFKGLFTGNLSGEKS